jgi:hypothetical protein
VLTTVAEPGENRFEELEGVVKEAVAFASRWPKELQPKVFEVALDEARGRRGTQPRPRVSGGVAAPSAAAIGGLDVLAEDLGVEVDAVARAVEIGEDGKVSILGRVDGRNRTELQVKNCVIYCYVRERALGERTTPIDELRVLCQREGCYDLGNFTKNFRGSDLLRENGQKGSHARSYVLSVKGVEQAKVLLKAMMDQ